MAFGSIFANDLLKFLLYNTDIANVGDAGGLRGSVSAGSLYFSLHTADPSAGDQTTYEAAYTGYDRVGKDRDTDAWNDAANQASNGEIVQYPTCTGGSSNVTHWSIGTAASGAGKLLFVGARTGGALAVTSGVAPKIEIDAATMTIAITA